jgi:hypothetical protein
VFDLKMMSRRLSGVSSSHPAGGDHGNLVSAYVRAFCDGLWPAERLHRHRKSHRYGKNPDKPDEKPIAPWYQVLLAHSWLHAGAVFLVTSSLTLAMFELIAHWCIDYRKCSGKLTYNQDQALHYGCKVAWAVLLAVYPQI